MKDTFLTIPAPECLEHGGYRIGKPVNWCDFLAAAIESNYCRCAGEWQHELLAYAGEHELCNCFRCDRKRAVIPTLVMHALLSLIDPYHMVISGGKEYYLKSESMVDRWRRSQGRHPPC